MGVAIEKLEGEGGEFIPVSVYQIKVRLDFLFVRVILQLEMRDNPFGQPAIRKPAAENDTNPFFPALFNEMFIIHIEETIIHLQNVKISRFNALPSDVASGKRHQ